MSRGMDKRKNYKKSIWKDPHYGYSDISMGSHRGDYGTHLKKRPRYYSEYSYSALENRYTGWEDKYRPRERYQHSVYDSLYDSEEDDTYRYNKKSKYAYDDAYDDTEYSYDEYDTDYTDFSDERWRKKFGDSKYLYSYEEINPGSRHFHSENKNEKYTSRNNHRRRINGLNVYALNDILGETGFTYDKHNIAKHHNTLDKFSETDRESDHLRQTKRNKKPEYSTHVYSTQINGNASAFDKIQKSLSPEKILSVTDYQEYTMLAFKRNTTKGDSDLIYLPIVMKDKGKHTIHKTGVKTYLTVHNSSESAEKPLEDIINKYSSIGSPKHNSFKHKKNGKYNQNIFEANKPNIKVYAVPSVPSQVFKQSAAKPKSVKKVISNNKFERGSK